MSRFGCKGYINLAFTYSAFQSITKESSFVSEGIYCMCTSVANETEQNILMNVCTQF